MSSAAESLASDQDATGNAILDALPADVRRRLLAIARPVELDAGTPLHEPGQPIRFVYFPLTCTVSLLHTTRSGESTEMAMVAQDGVVGITVCLGGSSMPNGAVVRRGGRAIIVPAGALQDEFGRSEPLRAALLRHIQALLIEISQIAACNRHHTIDQQLCRWLCLEHDRSPSQELSATHESIARMLGVRREGISVAMARLQTEALIRAARGRVEITDRPALEARACECYRVLRREHDRLMSASASSRQSR